MPHLFDELKVRGVTLRNRIGVSPMCQYSSENGAATDWHFVHLGTRAVGGAGLVIMEATAVEPRGRISPQDNGIWSDDHVVPLKRITQFVRAHGAAAGIQLAHAGRKASHSRPWDGEHDVAETAGGWKVIGPSPLRFSESYQVPQEMSGADISRTVKDFADAAQRALAAGFNWVEIHGAHGYLIHSFLSPLSNQRKDNYGGSFENRTRFLREVTTAVRKVWPNELPLSVRLSCSDWLPQGWSIDDTVKLSTELKDLGVDVVDCSSGGNSPDAKIPVGAGYQVPFAEAVRARTGMLTASVGMIFEAMQADELVRNGRTDIVLLARELLRDPYWPLHAAKTVHQQKRAPVPVQYLRAF